MSEEMSAPDPGILKLRQICRGFKASYFFLLLIFFFAILLVFIPDGVGAFRIRDGGAASLEQTRPSCNPLFGQCTEQKSSGVYSTASSSPVIGLRKKFDGPIGTVSRTTKVQQLVQESSEIDYDKERPVAGASNYLKSKTHPTVSRKITENVRSQVRFPTVVESAVGSTGRSGVQLEGFSENSDEDEKNYDIEEKVEDESADEDFEEDQNESEDYELDDEDNDADVDDEDEGNGNDDDDEDDDGDSQDAENEDNGDGNDDDDDDNDADDDGEEIDASDSHMSENDEAESNGRDEGEENYDETESDDDDDNENEPGDMENELNIIVSNNDKPATGSLAKIKLESKASKQEIISHVKNAAVSIKNDVKFSEENEYESVENVQVINKKKITGERRKQDVRIDSNTTKRDNIVGNENSVDRHIGGDEQSSAKEIPTGGANVQFSAISNSIEEVNSNDDKDDSNKKVTSQMEEEATPPARKLEKVRLADKFKSMEVHRAGSLEESVERIKLRKVEKAAIEVEKMESPQPEQTRIEKSEVKLPPKPVEKISSLRTSQETKETEVKEKKKTAPRPTKETKSQPKHSEKSKVKFSEAKSEKKSEKPKSTPKKRTEASITLSELNDLLLLVPSFVPNFTAVQDPLCQQHGKIFLRQLRGYKLWALQMLDSSAKIPSGMLRGNINQLGDFDQCLGVKAHVKVDEKTVKVQGKYCLATIDLQATRHDMKIPVNLMQSRASLRASANEPAHFIPRFTTANWALCVPAVCSADDVKSVMENALSAYNTSTGLRFTVGVDSDSCYIKQKAQPYSKETVAVLYFYAMTLCLVFVATLRDFFVTSEGPGRYSERIIMAFSLRRTIAALLLDSKSDEDIRCIHGIRTLTTILLYIVHKFLLISRIPFANRISLTEMANNPLSSILRVSIVYTDSFLLLSGVLTAYHMAKEFDKRGEIRWFCRFVARIIRLTPALLAVVFWYGFIMEHVGSGPQWNSIIDKNAELCKKNAWTNLLYIQNFFPFEEMCATHTHQLALDMQLSLLAPMLVFFLECKPIVGILVILFLLQVSATLRYVTTVNNFLSLIIFHGMTLKHLYRSANLMYISALHRATPYLFGVALGVLLRYTGKQVRIHKIFVVAGWLSATVLGSWSLLSQWRSARRDYTYDVEEATYFAVTLPVFWSISLSWIIFASFTNHGGLVNKFLSHHWMVILSRLSYSFYLIQFAVFFYNIGTTRYSTEFQLHKSIDLYEALTVVAVSIALTLLLDLPMHEIKKVIMECTDGELIIDTIGDKERNGYVTVGDENLTTEIAPEKGKAFVDEEVESTGWDWQKDIVSSRKTSSDYINSEEPPELWLYRKEEGRRKSFVRHDSDDAQIPTWDWIKSPVRKVSRRSDEEDRDSRTERRSQSHQEILGTPFVDESKASERSSIQRTRVEDSHKRDARSQSRASESRRSAMRDLEEPSRDITKRVDPFLRVGESGRSGAKEFDDSAREYIRREHSLAKEIESTAWKAEEQPSWEYVKRERSASHSAKDGKISLSKGFGGQSAAIRSSTGSLPRASELQKRISSDSEVEAIRGELPRAAKSMPLEEPRVSDEENWEYELRLRREKMAQNLPSEEMGTATDEEDWSILKRRSSAEGKMALLNDTSEIKNFGAWSISKVANPTTESFSHGSSESGEENVYPIPKNDYRETRPPFRESYDTHSEDENSWDRSRQRSYLSSRHSTSMDEEEGPSAYDFMLKRGGKRRSLQNLSKIPSEDQGPEDDSGWDFVKEENTDSSSPQTTSTGLFKRASIIKSQASEEDPEYMLPERPKLVEQEQEHPFKKAWQMQKSRSEEDGPVGFLVKEKDTTRRAGETEAQKEDEVRRNKPSAGGQAEDLSYFGGDEAESTSVSYPASNSGESASLDWIEDDERSVASGLEEKELESVELAEKDVQFTTGKMEQTRHSEESSWAWNQEET